MGAAVTPTFPSIGPGICLLAAMPWWQLWAPSWISFLEICLIKQELPHPGGPLNPKHQRQTQPVTD